MPSRELVPVERIRAAILRLRGQNVMLDADLAQLYGVETKALVRAVKRNLERFPADFMFQLTVEEFAALRYQSGTSSSRGGRRYRPFAFTEQGVAMLSSVLRSPRAVLVNIEIMRAFVRLRQLLDSHAGLARKLDELERQYDAQFRVVFDAIRELTAPPVERPRRIGFQKEEPRVGLSRSPSATSNARHTPRRSVRPPCAAPARIPDPALDWNPPGTAPSSNG